MTRRPIPADGAAAARLRGQRLFSERQYAAATLDLLLPDGDGLALAREIQHWLPVAVVSRRATAAREAEASLPGVVAWLDKPLDTLRLLDAVRRAEQAESARTALEGHR